MLREERGGCADMLKCGKGTTYEGGFRVPGLVYWKGKIRPGRSFELMSTLDILPTCLAVAGVTTTDLTLDGYNMSPVIFDNGTVRGRS